MAGLIKGGAELSVKVPQRKSRSFTPSRDRYNHCRDESFSQGGQRQATDVGDVTTPSDSELSGASHGRMLTQKMRWRSGARYACVWHWSRCLTSLHRGVKCLDYISCRTTSEGRYQAKTEPRKPFLGFGTPKLGQIAMPVPISALLLSGFNCGRTSTCIMLHQKSLL